MCEQVASYQSTTLDFTEPLRTTDSFTNICRSSLHAWVLDFYTPVNMEVIGTPEFNSLEG